MDNKPSPYFIHRNRLAQEEDAEILVDEPLEVGEDETPAFWDYWRVVKKRRWLIAACALAGAVGMGLYAFTRTPLYTSKSTILLEQKPSQVVRMQDAFGQPVTDDWDKTYEKTQFEILRRAAFAARAIRENSLDRDPLFNHKGHAEKKGLWGELSTWVRTKIQEFRKQEWVAEIFPAPVTVKADPNRPPVNYDVLGTAPGLVGRYTHMLHVRPVRNTNLVEIEFTTPNPFLSARLANAHAQSYLRYGRDLRSQANKEALVFLENKLLELKDRVEKSEAALNAYRREKGIITLDEKGNLVVDRLVDLNKRLTEAEAQRIALESEVRLIKNGHYDALPRVRESTIISSLKSELGTLEAEYADLAGEFKPGYPPLDTLKLKVDEVRRRLQREINTEVDAIRSAYQAARTNEKELRSRMERQKKAALNLKDAAVQYAILAREVDTNRQLYDSVLERMKEMGVAAQVRASNASIVEKALVPNIPSYPNKKRLLLLGLLLGMASGVGFAFFLDHIDTTIKTPEEAERYLGLPSLGVVPDFSRIKNLRANGYLPKGASSPVVEPAWPAPRDLVLSHHPRSVVAEAYRNLRTSILLSRPGAPPKTVLFTSASRGEGKTATAINTSVIFAQMGYRVVVLDADLRRPRGHRVLGMDNEVGLTEYLTGHRSQAQVVASTSQENLFFISSGTEPPNPSELLGSRKMKQFLDELQEEFDCIIIDSPPIMPVSDPILLSTMVDGVVLVVDGQHTAKQLVRDARSRLKKANAKVLGLVLNRVNLHDGDYAHYYKHYYSYYHNA
jgi:succinoglycan biosynthesis transport protein ExoP